MSSGSSEQSAGKPDHWAIWPGLAAFVATTAYWWGGLSESFPTWCICFLAAIAIAGWGVVLGVLRIALRRPRGALSALAATLVCVGGFYGGRAAMPYYAVWQQDKAFAAHRVSYDHAVSEWKSREDASTPFRLVVDTFDHSGFLTGIFYNIVYDESDKVGVDSYSFSGTWPCATPGWTTKKIVAFEDGRKFSRPLGGHFYFVEEIEP